MNVAALLHPRLAQLAPHERRAALRESQRVPFDILELVGMAAGLIAAGVFLHEASTGRAGLGMLLAVLAIAAFAVRRTRRGLRRFLGAAR